MRRVGGGGYGQVSVRFVSNHMTLEFRDHQILVISPGSQITQVQMGLNESFMPPAFEFPTIIYRDPSSGHYSVNEQQGFESVRPIVQGAIHDESAFLYLLKMIYKSVQPIDGLPPALYLVASLSWTRRQLERITHYCFEALKLPALAINLQGTSTSYAFATSDCLIIDVGYEKTEIAVVNGFEENKISSVVVPLGGNDVNKNLSKALPQFSAEQIEDLKLSSIYEVLSKDQTESQAAVQGRIQEEDGVVDIAAILSSGRTREILDERERQKQGDTKEPPNVSKKDNSFTDRHGASHVVGKERFQGCNELLNAIVAALADVIYSLPLREQEHLFDNVVICGKGSLITGFRTELAERLGEKYVIKAREPQAQISLEETEVAQQGPTRLAIVRLPDHFPEWKNRKWEDYTFLGAQVGSKQVFTAGMEGIFVSRTDYNDVGPSSIWDAYN